MYEFFKSAYARLLMSPVPEGKRYLYASFAPKGRLTGLIGPRGVGKTTLLLQYIKEHHANDQSVIYFSADNLLFKNVSLLNFIHVGYEEEGFRHFYIDEIHKYADWNQVLKNVYDAYPDVTIVFSGSSSIDLIKGSYDLSRRAVLFHLEGLSFREYLRFKHGVELEPIRLEALLASPREYETFLSQIPQANKHFKAYLRHGYYPFTLDDEETAFERINRVIEKNIYEDIASFYQIKTQNLTYFSKCLYFLAQIPPGQLSVNSLSKSLGCDNKTTAHYLSILEEIGLISLLGTHQTGAAALRKQPKAFLSNTTLLNALCDLQGVEPNTGMLREIALIQGFHPLKQMLHLSPVTDFLIGEDHLEVGGQGKTKKQLGAHQGYIVKDDTLVANPKTIPLMLFGFLY